MYRRTCHHSVHQADRSSSYLKSDQVQYDQFKEALKGLPGGAMQSYKLKGAIDQSGHLIITKPIEIPAGEVEIIILQSTPVVENSTALETEADTKMPESKRPSKIKAL